MKYVTRNGNSPQGIPKVYFTGHPEDCRQYFESISKDILKFQNCAIFYDENPEQPEHAETFSLDISRMQLIVIVITSRFVYQDTFAFREVFRYANENHIPILPILEEAGIEADFNRKCGDLQFLNPHSTDMTEISYEEKLKKFLNSVLIGDELAEKIRDAFDAYVFLSYRKKDRKYAQELMRLIHSNDFCRDIAIWYDEFLVPGENFNDAIQKAMEKSKLFALTVTPSLLENPNYVMTTEYPAAKDSGKTIIPVTLAPTDRNDLFQHYQGIPEPLASTDTPGISQALLDAIGALDRPENNNDPQHVFFIGLAYLSGVDVEINYERAVEMITFSAEAGLPEAIEKLVAMYRNGEGVARNYETAILWQERLVNTFREAYEVHPDENTGVLWNDAIIKLGDYLMELGDSRKADEIYRRAIEVCEHMYETYHVLWAKMGIGYSSVRLGRALQAEGSLTDAMLYYEKAITCGMQVMEQKNVPGVRRNLLVYSEVGDICRELGNYAKAYEFYLKDYEKHQELIEEENSEINRINQIRVITKIGELFTDQEQPEKGLPYFLDACRKCETMADIHAPVGYKQVLAGLYGRIGTVYKDLHDLANAETCFRKELALDLENAEQWDTPEIRRNVAIGNIHLGELYYQKGMLQEANTHYIEALKIRTELADQLDSVEALRDLANAYDKIGNLLRSVNNWKDAMMCSVKTMDICQELLKRTNSVWVWYDLYIAYGQLGDGCKAEGLLSEAKTWYRMTLQILKMLADRTDSVTIRQDIAFGCGKLGNICEDQNNRDEAKWYYYEAARVAAEDVKEHPTPRAFDTLALASMNYAILSKDPAEQIQYLQQAGAYYQKLAELFPENTYYRENLMKIRSYLESH